MENDRWVKRTTDFYQDPAPCCHIDQLHVVPEEALKVPEGATFLQKVAALDKCAFNQKASCATHLCECDLWRQEFDLWVAGLPCPDHSRANRNAPYENGPTNMVFITAAKYQIEKQTKVLIIENVTDCCDAKYVTGKLSGRNTSTVFP